jgi:hypothetical protein
MTISQAHGVMSMMNSYLSMMNDYFGGVATALPAASGAVNRILTTREACQEV